MKILHIINSLETGGAEKLLVETLPLYAEQGLTVDLAVLNGTEYPFLKELKEKNCCQIYSLGNSSVYNPATIFTIIPFLKNYDIVHVHLFPAKYFVVIAKLLSRTKTLLVFTEHSTTNRRIENYVLRLIDKQIIKFYTRTICITTEIREILMRYTSFSENRFLVIKNGVNLNAINRRLPYQKDKINARLLSSHFLITQVAAFREEKDHETLIKALAILPPVFKLILVGDGATKEKSIQLVNELQLESRVFFLGVRMDVPQLLKTSDAVVLSTKYEGLSLSSIEGMASGKPFIGSDVPGLSEIIQGAGILFPPGDERKLAEELLKLANDKEYYDEVVEKCLHRAKEFDIGKMVDEHITLYQKLLKE